MVKFGRELKNKVVTEWALQYLAYDFLKSILYEEPHEEEEKENDMSAEGDENTNQMGSVGSSSSVGITLGSMSSLPSRSEGGPAPINAAASPRSTLSQKLSSTEQIVYPFLKKISDLVTDKSPAHNINSNNNHTNNSNNSSSSNFESNGLF